MFANEIKEKIEALKKLALEKGVDVAGEIVSIEKKLGQNSRQDAVWNRVELARHPMRPYSMD